MSTTLTKHKEDKGIMILIVDDDQAVANMVKKLIQRNFPAIQEEAIVLAETAESALAFLADGKIRPEILITDYEMPGRTGISLIQTVRTQHPELKKIILMSGNFDQTQTPSGVVFFGKPFDNAKLIKTLAQMLNGKISGH